MIDLSTYRSQRIMIRAGANAWGSVDSRGWEWAGRGHLFLLRIPLISHLEDGTSYVIFYVNCSEYLHQGSFNNHKHWDPYDN